MFQKIKNINRFRIHYGYNTELMKLLPLAIIAVWVVIRGSSSPLIFDNAVFRSIFLSNPEGDKTLYNIGISVIAAFIFYLFQVYLSQKENAKRQISIYYDTQRHLILMLAQFCLAWRQFLKEPEHCKYIEFEYKFNGRDSGAINEELYAETIDEIKRCFYSIRTDSRYGNCDSGYQRFITISAYRIEGILSWFDDQFPRWSKEVLNATDYEFILDRIEEIEKINKTLSKITRYTVEIDQKSIKPYAGPSDVQKLAYLFEESDEENDLTEI